MKSLVSIVDSLLDTDYGETFEAYPLFVEWIIRTWKDIPMKLGSSHEFKSCWVNVKPYDWTNKAITAFVQAAHKQGRKYKITKKLAQHHCLNKDNITIISFGGLDSTKAATIGIGNPALNEAILINPVSRGPYDADFNHQRDMSTVKDPSLWSDSGNAYWDIMQALKNTKKIYYAVPADCWPALKNAVCS